MLYKQRASSFVTAIWTGLKLKREEMSLESNQLGNEIIVHTIKIKAIFIEPKKNEVKSNNSYLDTMHLKSCTFRFQKRTKNAKSSIKELQQRKIFPTQCDR